MNYQRLIIFLIRRKLGVKTYEGFRFSNQKTDDKYFFTKDHLMKEPAYEDCYGAPVMSKVGLNWLLDDKCQIVRVDQWHK